MIGVFDSGVGGLSIHRALVTHMPKADFVYLADQANTPYGGRDSQDILNLTRRGCEHLFAEGASLVVLACNTAAAIALRPLQQYWLPELRARHGGRALNVIGIIVPTIEVATGLPWNSTMHSAASALPSIIGVFATPATVRSRVYSIEIQKYRPDITVVEEPCPELARMIEAGAPHKELNAAVEFHAVALSSRIGAYPWQAILGCTHYEIIADLFANALPVTTQLIHQPIATANALVRYLSHHRQYDPGHSGMRRFLTTGKVLQSALAETFWGGELAFSPLPAGGA